MEAEAAGALAAEASSQVGGSEQALWAVCAQLRALPELADCSDLAWYLAKKYAPAAEREGKLGTSSSGSRIEGMSWMVLRRS